MNEGSNKRLIFAKEFKGHPAQNKVWVSDKRFIDIMAGRRGGKDHIGVRRAMKRIYQDLNDGKSNDYGDFSLELPGLHYWFCAPTYSLIRVITKHLLRSIPKWLILKNGLNGASPKIWLKPNILIEFKSCNNPELLVGEGLHGIYVTETARLKASVWNDNLRPTLTEKNGWGIFTTTPIGHNWYMSEIRALAEDPENDEWEAHYWKTSDNTSIKNIVDEVAKAKASMPLKYYLRNYEASPDAFMGQIYDGFNSTHHYREFAIDRSRYKYTVGGMDWVYSHKGCLFIIGITHDDSVDVLEVIAKAGVMVMPPNEDDRDTECWKNYTLDMIDKWGIECIFAGPDEPEHIAALRQCDIPCQPAFNAVGPGIQIVSTLMHIDKNGQSRFRINSGVHPDIKKAFTRYSWKNDKNGVSSEEPDKKDDDEVDGCRYAIYSAYKRGMLNKVSSDVVDDTDIRSNMD